MDAAVVTAAAVTGYLLPPVAPVVAIGLAYVGYRWYLIPDQTRERLGKGTLVVALLLFGYGAVALTGYVTTGAFENAGAAVAG